MMVLYIIFMTLSVALNIFLFFVARRLANRYWEAMECAKERQKLLVKAVAAVTFYNEHIAKGTVELPKLDWMHGDYQ